IILIEMFFDSRFLRHAHRDLARREWVALAPRQAPVQGVHRPRHRHGRDTTGGGATESLVHYSPSRRDDLLCTARRGCNSRTTPHADVRRRAALRLLCVTAGLESREGDDELATN